MIQYTSTRGQTRPVGFDRAVLQGFAQDGGLFVPQTLPRFSRNRLEQLSCLGYEDLAFEILSPFIGPEIIPQKDLARLITKSFGSFGHKEIIPITALAPDPAKDMGAKIHIMELFHGPTLSFKDVAMGLLVNIIDYFLSQKGDRLNLVLATTGDTGPAAAHAAAGKKTIDCWPLYPLGMITPEQEAQMTGLDHANIHPMGVRGCPDGGDDLDLVVARLFADKDLSRQLKLSSVNSINWCRVMVQSVHYFYAYFRVIRQVGDPVVFSVPSGAFGNLFAGYLASLMGLPVHGFICANNENQALHRAFSTGVFKKQDLIQTLSSAIDITVPYNFWRFLYFASKRDDKKLRQWMDQFKHTGEIRLGKDLVHQVQSLFLSCSVSDGLTLETIRQTWDDNGCLLDPHSAVALAGAKKFRPEIVPQAQIICLATAHPAKFPDVIKKALGPDLPDQAFHPALEQAKKGGHGNRVFEFEDLESELVRSMGHAMEKSGKTT